MTQSMNKAHRVNKNLMIMTFPLFALSSCVYREKENIALFNQAQIEISNNGSLIVSRENNQQIHVKNSDNVTEVQTETLLKIRNDTVCICQYYLHDSTYYNHLHSSNGGGTKHLEPMSTYIKINDVEIWDVSTSASKICKIEDLNRLYEKYIIILSAINNNARFKDKSYTIHCNLNNNNEENEFVAVLRSKYNRKIQKIRYNDNEIVILFKPIWVSSDGNHQISFHSAPFDEQMYNGYAKINLKNLEITDEYYFYQ